MTETVESGAPALPGFHILVPVWGADYCDVFTQVSLPSQLAPGNLPSLPHINRCLYHVLTRTEDDAARIQSAPAWQRLRSLLPVRIEPLAERKKTTYETMSALLRTGIDCADRKDAAILFFNPDLVFADGTVNALVRSVRNSRRVIFTTGIRLLKETVIPELLQFRHDDNAIVLTPRNLAAIALRNLHPISKQNFWSEKNDTFLPATIFWPVEDEGLVARCFHLHPLLVWPERKHVQFRGTVDDDFVGLACPRPETDHVVVDSDELLMCEISAFSPVTKARYRKGSITDVADWAESHTDERHRRLVTFPIRIHATEMSEPLWSAAEATSSQVVDAALVMLQRGGLSLSLRSPMRLFRRWLRRAAARSMALKNQPKEAWRTDIAMAYLAFHRGYSAFCARYEILRTWLNDIIFGPPDAPYPWNSHWFTSRNPARAVLQLIPAQHERVLIITPNSHVRRLLARHFVHAELMAWPQYGVAAAGELGECWPYGDGAFDWVACVNALQLAPKPLAFMTELVRVLAPNGQAVIITPELPPDISSIVEVKRSIGLAGLGSNLAVKLSRWSEYQGRVRRLSPVILEIPLLPLLILLRLTAGCIAVLGASLGDLVDRSGRFHTNRAILLTPRARKHSSPSH